MPSPLPSIDSLPPPFALQLLCLDASPAHAVLNTGVWRSILGVWVRRRRRAVVGGQAWHRTMTRRAKKALKHIHTITECKYTTSHESACQPVSLCAPRVCRVCTWCWCPGVGVVLGAGLLPHTSRQGSNTLQQDTLRSEHVP